MVMSFVDFLINFTWDRNIYIYINTKQNRTIKKDIHRNIVLDDKIHTDKLSVAGMSCYKKKTTRQDNYNQIP